MKRREPAPVSRFTAFCPVEQLLDGAEPGTYQAKMPVCVPLWTSGTAYPGGSSSPAPADKPDSDD